MIPRAAYRRSRFITDDRESCTLGSDKRDHGEVISNKRGFSRKKGARGLAPDHVGRYQRGLCAIPAPTSSNTVLRTPSVYLKRMSLPLIESSPTCVPAPPESTIIEPR